MAKSKNYSVLGGISAWLGEIRFTFKGIPLLEDDDQLMRLGLHLQYALACDLLPESRLYQYQSWLASTQEIDVYQFGKFLANFDQRIKSYLKEYEESCGCQVMDVPSFKRSAVDCKGFWGFISPIYPELQDFLAQPTYPNVRLIIQWVNFLRRINLRGLDLTEEMEQEYIAFEDEMSTWQYDPELMDELNCIIREWFPSTRDFSDFRPKHGPGSVSGRKGRPSVVRKHTMVEIDRRLMYLSKYIGPLSQYLPCVPDVSLERISEIVCVPKSMITNRTISKEPVALQYFQQGIMKCIMDDVHKHPILSRHISFTDQSLSAEMARQGSIWGDYATIDLSSASDSVTLDIVKSLFRGTWILPMVLTTRSDMTELPSGRILKLRKFAPMGSAVCFPIETIVFAACCERAVRHTGGRARYRVFGDDIVISEGAVDCLIETLTACHFKVNDTKSFRGTELLNFREACGGEYFNGHEVTPLRISRKFSAPPRFTTSDADQISSYISFANQAYDAGYLQLRKELIQYLRDHMPKWLYENLVFSAESPIGIKTFPSGATNYRLSSRINTALIRKEVLGYIPTSIVPTDSCERCLSSRFDHTTCEHIRYFEWQRLYGGHSDTQREVDCPFRICPASSVMRKAWIATDCL